MDKQEKKQVEEVAEVNTEEKVDKVEESVETEAAKEAPNPEEVEVVKDEKPTEESAPTEEAVEEEPKADEEVSKEEKAEEELVEADKAEEKGDKPDEENNPVEQEEEQPKPEQKEEQEVKEPEEDELTRVKAELEEKKAELEEKEMFDKLDRDTVQANTQLNKFLEELGKAMEAEFKRYGIDASMTIEELEKVDMAKANVARGIVAQAQKIKDEAMTNMANNLNAEFNDVVFTKASRLFEKFNLSEKQAQIAAETFVDILEQSGLKNFAEDLVAKVELAVARARMIVPKVFDAIQQSKKVSDKVEEILQDVEDGAVEIATTELAAQEAKAEAEAKAEEDKEEKEEKPEEVVEESKVIEEVPTVDEFMESATISTQQAGSPLTVENVLQEMSRLSDKDRVKFYVQNRALVEKAMAKKANADRRRI